MRTNDRAAFTAALSLFAKSSIFATSLNIYNRKPKVWCYICEETAPGQLKCRI